MKKLLPIFCAFFSRLVNSQGYTLTEVVISMMVIGLVVLVITNVPQSINLIGTSNKESLAKDIALKKVEDLRIQGYSLLANGNTQIIDPRLNNLPAASSAVTISDCPVTICSHGEHTKQAEIKVSWNESGKIKNVDFMTLISEGGLQ